MAKGLDWLLSFSDKISGPARAMLGAIDELDAKLAAMVGTFGTTDDAIDKTAGKLSKLGKEFDALQKLQAGKTNTGAGAYSAMFDRQQAVIKAAGGVDANTVNEAWEKLRADAKAANDVFAKSYKAPSLGMDFTAERSAGPQSAFARLVQSLGASSPGAAQGLMNVSQGLVDVDTGLQAVGLSLEGVVAGFAAAGVAAAAFVAIGATAIVLKGSSMVLDAVAFKETTIDAFAILMKSRDAAQEAYSVALATADDLGLGPRETLQGFNELLARGFNLTEVDNLTRAMADLAAVNPAANTAALLNNIGKIKGQGVVQGDEINALAEAGLSLETLYEKIGEKIGKSAEEVKKLKATGKLTSEMAIPAILESIQELTGKELGGAAQAKANTISGLLKQLSFDNISDRLLLDLDLGPGAENVRGFLQNLNELLKADSEAGKRLRDVIGSSFGGLFTAVFGDLSGADGAKTLEATILKIVGLVESVLAGVTGFFSGFGGALADGLGLGAKAFSEMSAPQRQAALEKISEQFAKLGSALGTILVFGAAVVGMFVGLGEAASVAMEAVFSPLTLIGDMLDALIPSFQGKGSALGRAIAEGMTFGIYGLLSQIFGAGAAMGSAAEDGLRTKTQTHSPSRLFDTIAGDLIGGFTGRMANDNGPEMAAAALIGSPAELAQDARQAGARMGGGAPGGAGSRTYYITVNAPSGRAEDIRESLADLLDELEASAA